MNKIEINSNKGKTTDEFPEIQKIIDNYEINETEQLEEIVTMLSPGNVIEDKNSHDTWQRKLEQYDLEYIAKMMNNSGGLFHNAKVVETYEMIEFLKDAKDHEFGVNLLISNLPDEILVCHVPAIECSDVYNTNTYIYANVVDKTKLGAFFYMTLGDSVRDFIEDLQENKCKNCYWHHVDNKIDDMICGWTSELPKPSRDCNFKLLESE